MILGIFAEAYCLLHKTDDQNQHVESELVSLEFLIGIFRIKMTPNIIKYNNTFFLKKIYDKGVKTLAWGPNLFLGYVQSLEGINTFEAYTNRLFLNSMFPVAQNLQPVL